MMILLFDGECPLCRRLAHYAERASAGELTCETWESFRKRYSIPESRTEQLRIYHKGQLHEGEAAWQLLLHKHPSLRSVSWLAAKLGLEKSTARALQRGGHALRRLCAKCRR